MCTYDLSTLFHQITRLSKWICFFTAILTKDGHTVVLVKIQDRNSVEITVNGENIFQCDINDLDYGKQISLFITWKIKNCKKCLYIYIYEVC
jgi:hypothetical protein